MSRSNYVYIVQHPTTQIPLAAFTVKHELMSWITRRLADDTLLPQTPVWRVRDGWRTGEQVLLGTVAQALERAEVEERHGG
ncbi:hypothetical protein ABT369_38710 [Dactylosporangium sp. NPDC000244]|uniref:hypothetical protein n=1 Tax=Dactylosporangium sp. NPDC000244 TaxID=3154365 RepID=UPI003323FF6E